MLSIKLAHQPGQQDALRNFQCFQKPIATYVLLAEHTADLLASMWAQQRDYCLRVFTG